MKRMKTVKEIKDFDMENPTQNNQTPKRQQNQENA